jgi:hypothetical protein
MAGASSDQKLAAIMTPPANPSIVSRNLRPVDRVKKTTAAPRAVAPQVKQPAIRASMIGLCREKNSTAIHSFYAMVHLSMEGYYHIFFKNAIRIDDYICMA